MSNKVDLIYFSANETNWYLGNSYVSAQNLNKLKQLTEQVVAKTDADWILFWDYSLGNPDEQIILQLSAKPADVLHAGLKLGTTGLPDVLNYVHPVWMYNIDGSEEVSHSNFRMSLQACMIRVEVLKNLGTFSDTYTSMEMSAVAYGYSILKHGGIIRYQADLVKNKARKQATVPLQDEWIFARQFFKKKWQLWTLYNKPGFIANLSAWRKTKHIGYANARPTLHSSEKTNSPVKPATVSVLAPTLDRYPYLEEELRELNEQTILPHEVLITDQTDEERRQLIDFSKYKNITVKYFPQDSKGQCLAWNKLIKEATGEYIFFFGDDAYNIHPELIEKMLQTMYRFDADMVASNVIEKGIKYGKSNYHYYMSDTFPITLIKKSVVEKAGGMDMFFNRNVKADHDLAMRCHLNGALMIFDPSAEIGHHRAPSGGLRAHKARVITNFMTKNTITKVLNPSTSEIFIYNKYYTNKQFRQHVRIKYMNQVIINGNIIKKLLRLIVFAAKIPSMRREYKANLGSTQEEFAKRGMKFGQ